MKLLYSTFILLLLVGCSTKSNFYQLHPKQVKNAISRAHLKQTVIGIAEIDLPDYLDKPEVVTRLSQDRLQINETDRWAGDLDKNIQSVLSDDLSALMPRYTFMNTPWDEPLKERYRIYVSIDHFDGDANGTVIFEGRWSLVDTVNDRLVTGEEVHYRLSGGTGIDALVRTQSRVLEHLSRRIAQKIRHYL